MVRLTPGLAEGLLVDRARLRLGVHVRESGSAVARCTLALHVLIGEALLLRLISLDHFMVQNLKRW